MLSNRSSLNFVELDSPIDIDARYNREILPHANYSFSSFLYLVYFQRLLTSSPLHSVFSVSVFSNVYIREPANFTTSPGTSSRYILTTLDKHYVLCTLANYKTMGFQKSSHRCHPIRVFIFHNTATCACVQKSARLLAGKYPLAVIFPRLSSAISIRARRRDSVSRPVRECK